MSRERLPQWEAQSLAHEIFFHVTEYGGTYDYDWAITQAKQRGGDETVAKFQELWSERDKYRRERLQLMINKLPTTPEGQGVGFKGSNNLRYKTDLRKGLRRSLTHKKRILLANFFRTVQGWPSEGTRK